MLKISKVGRGVGNVLLFALLTLAVLGVGLAAIVALIALLDWVVGWPTWVLQLTVLVSLGVLWYSDASSSSSS